MPGGALVAGIKAVISKKYKVCIYCGKKALPNQMVCAKHRRK